MRCDTFSKFVSPGLRCGFVTAPQCIIQRLAMGTGPSLGVASSVQVSAALHPLAPRVPLSLPTLPTSSPPHCTGSAHPNRDQVMLHAMLEAWGDAGLHAHVQRTQREYRRRCALALRAAVVLKALMSYK